MISELMVLYSAAGYYIGRRDTKDGSPYSRESGYYPSYETAEVALDGFEVRSCAENNFAYDNGNLPDIRKVSPKSKKNNRVVAKKPKTLLSTTKKYPHSFNMVQAAINAGFRHVVGFKGFDCKVCGQKFSALKFLKNRGTVYACMCGGRWGSLINQTTTVKF